PSRVNWHPPQRWGNPDPTIQVGESSSSPPLGHSEKGEGFHLLSHIFIHSFIHYRRRHTHTKGYYTLYPLLCMKQGHIDTHTHTQSQTVLHLMEPEILLFCCCKTLTKCSLILYLTHSW